jgi:hypothetical protein
MKQQSTFSRSLANEAKMGAYFTDKRVCKKIASYIDFGSNNVNILEPTIGDASAILTITEGKENVSIFGVELDKERYEQAKKHIESNLLYRVILSDFLKARITHDKMDMVFANPPYLKMEDGKIRNNLLNEMTRYISKGGLLVYVVGRSLLENEMFRKYLVANYTNIKIVRFPTTEEYKQEYGVSYQFFNQICIFAYKRQRHLLMNEEEFKEEITAFNSVFNEEVELELISYQQSPIFKIMTSHSTQSINDFKGNIVDVKSTLSSMGYGMYMINKRKSFLSLLKISIGNTPPIDPKKEHKYFIAISATSAIIGEEGEKHMLRTFVTTSKTSSIEQDDETGDKVKVVERTNAKVVANVLNADGTIVSIM